jgi:hypothetical protein
MPEPDNLPIHYRGAIEEQVAPDWDSFGSGPSERSARTAWRERLVLHLRALGYDFDQIRDKLIEEGAAPIDIKASTVEAICRRAIDRVKREAPEPVRKLELKRCDMLQQVYMQKALEGHGPSCDRVLAIMERRSRIEGIDAPVEIDLHHIRSQFFALLRQAIPDDLAEIGSGTELYAQVLNYFVETQRRA